MITEVGRDNLTHPFSSVAKAVVYIREHPEEPFTIYASVETYRSIREQIVEAENWQDPAAL